MAWIKSNEELGHHPKMKKLARLLSISWPEAIGYLHYLWWWALNYAQDGDLTKYEPGDIADAVFWTKEPKELVDALIESGFLDLAEDGELSIHDWFDYTGDLFVKREANRERMRKARAKAKETSAKNVQRTTTERTGAREEKSREEKKREEESRKEENKKDPPAKTHKPKEKYAEFVSLTNDEYSSLVAKLGEDGTARCIEILDNYKGANGKKYKSDYRAILNWVIERYEEEQTKKQKQGGQSSNVFLDMLKEDGKL